VLASIATSLAVAWTTPDAQAQSNPGSTKILSTTIARDGRVQIRVASSSDKYYVLYRSSTSAFGSAKPVSIKLGDLGETTLTESLGASGPAGYYQVMEYFRASPGMASTT
jgi:hypothetical protein